MTVSGVTNTGATSNTATSTANNSALNSATGNLTTFLKILTTQLQNQDPTAATDTNQFTQELVQFASAEQQINTNTKLDNIASLLKNSNGAAASLGYMGQSVEVASTGALPLQSGASEIGYTLDSASKTTKVTISDADGNTVAILNGTTNSGSNYVSWDGKDGSGVQQPDGAYTFKVVATDKDGNSVNVSNMSVIGKVTSITSNSDGTQSLGLGTGVSALNTYVDAVYSTGNGPVATPLTF